MKSVHLIAVTGGRNFDDRALLERALSKYYLNHCSPQPTALIHGDASGADRLARDWARKQSRVFEVPVAVRRATWSARIGYGKGAGPIRNRVMLSMMPEILLVFPGGSGTRSAHRIAWELGIRVWRPAEYSLCHQDPEWDRQ